MPKKALGLLTTPSLPEKLFSVPVKPDSMVRVSSHNTNEPFFANHQGNRFDDPNPDENARYSTCYFGENLDVAIAETLLHDSVPENGYFYVGLSIITARYVIRFQPGPDLILADLTGRELKRMGGHAGLSGTRSLKIPQAWSSAIYHHKDNVDGFQYQSRHLNNSRAYVIFGRAKAKLTLASATLLSEDLEFGPASTRLYIDSTGVRPRRK